MDYDFTTVVNRHQQNSSKWALMKMKNPNVPDNIIPLSVADMELKNAPEIIEGLKTYLDDMILGYTSPGEGYYQALIDWMKRRHQWEIQKEWVLFTTGVVSAVAAAVRAYSNPNDGVIIQQPVYYPFKMMVEMNGRRVVNNPLKLVGDRYVMDYQDLAEKAKDPNNKMIILCSPHNPVGRVWDKEELEKLVDICVANDVIIISDEIHFDLIRPGYHHTVLATLSQKAADHCVVLTAPSKTFNLAGMHTSNIIIPNQKLRELYAPHAARSLTVLGFKACELAYTKAENWLDQCIELLFHNADLVENFLKEKMPMIKALPLEGTYLQWIDFSAWGLEHLELEKFMLEEAFWFTDEGYIFGDEGIGYERINLAAPTWVIEESLQRLYSAAQKRGFVS